jgi:hypothetical protein
VLLALRIVLEITTISSFMTANHEPGTENSGTARTINSLHIQSSLNDTQTQ